MTVSSIKEYSWIPVYHDDYGRLVHIVYHQVLHPEMSTYLSTFGFESYSTASTLSNMVAVAEKTKIKGYSGKHRYEIVGLVAPKTKKFSKLSIKFSKALWAIAAILFLIGLTLLPWVLKIVLVLVAIPLATFLWLMIDDFFINPGGNYNKKPTEDMLSRIPANYNGIPVVHSIEELGFNSEEPGIASPDVNENFWILP